MDPMTNAATTTTYSPAGSYPPGTGIREGVITFPTWFDPEGVIWFDQIETLRKADPGFDPYDPQYWG